MEEEAQSLSTGYYEGSAAGSSSPVGRVFCQNSHASKGLRLIFFETSYQTHERHLLSSISSLEFLLEGKDCQHPSIEESQTTSERFHELGQDYAALLIGTLLTVANRWVFSSK